MSVSNVASMSKIQELKTFSDSDFRNFCAEVLQIVELKSSESAISLSDLPSPLEGLNLAKVFTDQSSFIPNLESEGCKYSKDEKTLFIYNFLLENDLGSLSLNSVKDIVLEIVCGTEFFQQFKADRSEKPEEEVKNEFFKLIMNQFDISNSAEGLILTLKQYSEIEPKTKPTSMCAKMRHSLFFILKISAYWSLFSKIFVSDQKPDLLFGGNSYQTQGCAVGFRNIDLAYVKSQSNGGKLFYLCAPTPACPDGMTPNQPVHLGNYPFGPVRCLPNKDSFQQIKEFYRSAGYEPDQCSDVYRPDETVKITNPTGDVKLFHACSDTPACPEGMKPDQSVHLGDYPFGPVRCLPNKDTFHDDNMDQIMDAFTRGFLGMPLDDEAELPKPVDCLPGHKSVYKSITVGPAEMFVPTCVKK